jgi:thymidine kinase
MPKIIFRYGTMNSSKTANLLMVAYNYSAQDKQVFVIKPECDTRFGSDTIKSRAFENGIKADLMINPELEDINEYINVYEKLECILVDECQFLSSKNIEALRFVKRDVPIICYGLRTDYRSKLFPGSQRLMEIADTIEEIKTVCVCCSNKAIINAKYYIDKDNKIFIREGTSEIDLGGEEKYQPLCWKCWQN